MALKYPSANGNWSTAANWNGGTKPVDGDTVCLNGKTITLDENTANLATLTSTAQAPAAAGGSLSVTTGGYTITVNNGGSGILAGLNHVVLISHTGGGNTTVNTNIIEGSNSTNNIYGIYVTIGSGNTCTITGTTLKGGTFYLRNWSLGVVAAGNVTVNTTNLRPQGAVGASYGVLNFSGNGAHVLNCDVYGYDVANSTDKPVIQMSLGTTDYTLNGNVYGPVSTTSNSTIIGSSASSADTSRFIINGNVIGGSAYHAIINSTTGRVKILGNCTGGSTGAWCGIYANGANSITEVEGTTTGGSYYGAYGAWISQNAATGRFTHVTASAQTAGVYCNAPRNTYTADLSVSGNITNTGSTMAIVSDYLRLETVNAQNWTFQTATIDKVLDSALVDTGQPAEDDVRDQTVYGSVGQFTGSLKIAPKSTVLLNVPTDDGVGTLVMSATDIGDAVWNRLTSAITTPNSIGKKIVDNPDLNYSNIADIIGTEIENNFP